jgi:hypothetical protein
MSCKTRGHQTVELVGDLYELFFEGQHNCWEETYFRDHYESKQKPLYQWRGTGRLTDRSTGQWWAFQFSTARLDARSPISSRSLLQSVIDIEGDKKPVIWWKLDDEQRKRLEEWLKYRPQDKWVWDRILGFEHPKPNILDFLAKKIAKEVTVPPTDRAIHHIDIPVITIKELKAAGIMLMLPGNRLSLPLLDRAALQSGPKEAN